MTQIKISSSIDDLFFIATYLVCQDGGDGDCTIMCDNPEDLADKYESSKFKPKHWVRDNLLYHDNYEYLKFNNIKEKRPTAATFIIEFIEG